MMIFPRLLLLTGVAVLAACSGGNQYADLDAFVAEKRASPSGQIAPIPALKAYRAFSYVRHLIGR